MSRQVLLKHHLVPRICKLPWLLIRLKRDGISVNSVMQWYDFLVSPLLLGRLCGHTFMHGVSQDDSQKESMEQQTSWDSHAPHEGESCVEDNESEMPGWWFSTQSNSSELADSAARESLTHELECPFPQYSCENEEQSESVLNEWGDEYSSPDTVQNSRIRDGGGLISDADWATPKQDRDWLRPLRARWRKRIREWGLKERCGKPLEKPPPGAPCPHRFSKHEEQTLRSDLFNFLQENDIQVQ